jgi:CBS domain containing-hemolysin-like protein
VVIHAVVVLAFTALTNVRQAPLREQAEDGNQRAKHVLRLNDNYTRLNATYQLSLMVLHVVAAVIATLGIAQPWLRQLQGEVSSLVVYGGVVVGLALIFLLLGDLLPAALGSAYADALAPWMAYPMSILLFMFSPVVALMMFLGKLLSRLFGDNEMAAAVTEEEIMTLVDAGQKEGTIERDEKDMIFSVLQLSQTLAREVMVPRMDIIALDVDTPIETALARFVQSGHSRIPVYTGTIDNIEGLLYAKDLLAMWHNGGPKPQSIRDLLRPAYFVPESKRADLLLNEFRASKIHMALVVDEYGGTAGLLTIENLIEEIVGDIQDEYDIHEEADYVQINPDEYTIDASMDLDDINHLLDVELPTEENDTLGGYIYSKLGHVPVVGEIVEDDRLVMRVDQIEGRRIRKVHVLLKRPVDETAEIDKAKEPESAQADTEQPAEVRNAT